MNKQKIQNLTLSLFYLIIVAVPIFWVTHGHFDRERSLAEARYLRIFPVLSIQGGALVTDINKQVQTSDQSDSFFGQFSDRTFQRVVDQAASDQFPFRFTGIVVDRAFERTAIRLAYAFLPDKAIPTDMHSGLYVMRDGSALIAGPVNYSNKTKKQLEKKSEELNSLINTNPDIHFYMFYHQKLGDSPYHPLNTYFKNADEGKAWKYFSGIAPANLTISTMMLTSFEDNQKFYFRTDHHMNVNGSLFAYDQVYDMLATGYPGISPKLNTENVLVFPKMDFLGSYARRSLYPIEADDFSVPITSQPPFIVYKNGQEFHFSFRKEYLAGDYLNLPYINQYGQYYGNDPSPFIDFRSENGSNRSILVIGSSYCRPVLPLLAAHFQHVYYLDLRHSPDFSLKKFIKDHPVDDILLFTDYSILVDNDTWKINP